jgi:hypothetical protein
MEVPMLEEHEWEQVAHDLREMTLKIKTDRAARDAELADVKRPENGNKALARYFQLTGVRETNVDALRHHRLALYGGPCRACGKPLRTPRAKRCAECGTTVSD